MTRCLTNDEISALPDVDEHYFTPRGILAVVHTDHQIVGCDDFVGVPDPCESCGFPVVLSKPRFGPDTGKRYWTRIRRLVHGRNETGLPHSQCSATFTPHDVRDCRLCRAEPVVWGGAA